MNRTAMRSPLVSTVAHRAISIGSRPPAHDGHERRTLWAAPTTLLTRHIAARVGQTLTRWQLLARSVAGHALRAAVPTLVVVTTGGLEDLVNELRLIWTRLRLLSRGEAGYATRTAVIVSLVVVIAFTAFVVLWMTVISKAIHTRVSCHPPSPCG